MTREAEIETKLDAARRAVAAPLPEVNAGTRPDRYTFDNPDAYETALLEYGTKKAVPELARERAEKELVQHADTAVTAMRELWNHRAKDLPVDLNAMLAEKGAAVPMSQAMGAAIMSSKVGPQVAHHLMTHPEESTRIATIADPVRQVAEIGKLEATLTAAKRAAKAAAKPASPAPAPRPSAPTRAAAKAATAEPVPQRTLYDVGNDPGGMAEYSRMRAEQRAAERGHRRGRF
jgi:hypothetical protein